MADVSLWSGGRAHDHVVQQRFSGVFVPPGVWRRHSSIRKYQGALQQYGRSDLQSPCPSCLHTASWRLQPSLTTCPHIQHSFSTWFPRPHLPHCPAEVAKEKPRPLVCLQLSGSLLRDLFHRPHLHISNLTRHRGETIAQSITPLWNLRAETLRDRQI